MSKKLEITTFEGAVYNYKNLNTVDIDIWVPFNEFLDLHDIFKSKISGGAKGLYMIKSLDNGSELWIYAEG